MLRARCFPALLVVVASATGLGGAVRVARAESPGALADVPLPGGLHAALAVVEDRVTPDRSRFLLEFIRRTYHGSNAAKQDPREAVLRAFLMHLEQAAQRQGADAISETLPLPLSPSIWIDVVFGGRSTPSTLVADIVRTRGPALLYYGLLSLDDDTRAWIATRPVLLRDIATRYAAGFSVAAPGLRVSNGAVRVPGAPITQAAWEALIGRRISEPEEFVRTIVSDGERRLPFLVAAMAQLTPQQTAYVLDLHDAEGSAKTDALRRLHTIFERLAPGWRIDDRTFWRPVLDPTLLAGELTAGADGMPLVPGTRRFWTAAFADAEPRLNRPEDARELAGGKPLEFLWLCEQIFSGDQRRRAPAVLFASRVVRQITPQTAGDALESVRAMMRYPALVTALERAGVRDVGVIAAAARRATTLSAIDDGTRAYRALAQFQGALAILTRAALRHGVADEALPRLVISLAAVELSAQGEYEGRISRWLESVLEQATAAALPENMVEGETERRIISMLAGVPASVQYVDWEGTRYRVDPRAGEAIRLARILGEHTRPHLTSARALMDAADTLADAKVTRERMAAVAKSIDQVAAQVAGEHERTLRRLAQDVDARSSGRVSAALKSIADGLLAEALLEYTYAVALGHPDRAVVTASDAAARHDFGLTLGAVRRIAPWRLPAAGTGLDREWRATGSLLGLDVKLADFALVAVSSRPPARRPSVMDEDRRVFSEVVALAQPASLTDADRDTIAAAIAAGRARLAAARSSADLETLANEVRLGAARRSLLAWSAAHDPDAVPGFLSLAELMSLGSAGQPLTATLHTWGSPAEPRLGCLCLGVLDRRPLESFDGRWNSGVLASAFPDLNFRIAELLAELQMPAVLLPSLLAAAVLDLVNTAECRDPDDRRGLSDFVRQLRPERLEQYLALLTSDGPLVPMTETASEVAR